MLDPRGPPTLTNKFFCIGVWSWTQHQFQTPFCFGVCQRLRLQLKLQFLHYQHRDPQSLMRCGMLDHKASVENSPLLIFMIAIDKASIFGATHIELPGIVHS
ncbi:hypothetical protein Pan181_10040 [Aeoliella mucimassa]|uniref:Uncharacterized protein n=1 Tax=Aeoliella mucimassa TaxID=2527972 RepID=A0A518AJA4_9BACT|nr:hypothetical protein Pan181_10040 [Aeoliella mucimassa]